MTSFIPISLSKSSVNSVEDRQQRTFDLEMTTSKYRVTRRLLAFRVTKLVALMIVLFTIKYEYVSIMTTHSVIRPN